jgi:hypothetical protein
MSLGILVACQSYRYGKAWVSKTDSSNERRKRKEEKVTNCRVRFSPNIAEERGEGFNYMRMEPMVDVDYSRCDEVVSAAAGLPDYARYCGS